MNNDDKPDLRILWYLLAGFGAFLVLVMILVMTTKPPKPYVAPYVPPAYTATAAPSPVEPTPHADLPNNIGEPKPTSSAPAEDLTGPIRMDLESLRKAYLADPAEGDRKYKGRAIESSGIVFTMKFFPDVPFWSALNYNLLARCDFTGKPRTFKKYYEIAFTGTVDGLDRSRAELRFKGCKMTKIVSTQRHDPNSPD